MHQAFQALVKHMGVNLCRGDIGMAEHLLYRTQIGAMVQEVAGEGVAQHVRRHLARIEASLDCQILQQLTHAMACQVAASPA